MCKKGMIVVMVMWMGVVVNAWKSLENRLWWKAGVPFQLKGVNWFGFETECRVVHGLWAVGVDELFDFLQVNQYNAIRIPLAYELMNSLDEPASSSCLQQNTWMIGMPVRDLLHVFFQKAAERGMVLLLDFHTIKNLITPGPYTDSVSPLDVRAAWFHILDEYRSQPNLLGIDIKNEPHGVSWKEWGSYAVQFIEQATARYPDFQGLFFVEGIQDLNDHSVWGGSFSNMPDGIEEALAGNPAVVFSPHVYGVSIRGSSAQYDNDDTFRTWFGFLRETTSRALVIGEVGGFFLLDDYDWHMTLLHYLQSIDIHDAFYWCLNPDSVDTQGLLMEDWRTPNQGKLDFHRTLQPNPTRMTF